MTVRLESNQVVCVVERGRHQLSLKGRSDQGLILVHFSAQLEPSLTHKNTLYSLDTPLHTLSTGYTTPTRTPYPIKKRSS